ncbi:hypothetical protein V8G54_031911 [Vigna mungo]|uniref:Uncharacterized protein n=1 Tax=Vigna mungo TaxID=3915 RepID=A0AAQ3REX3_VIGMU
MTIHNHPNPILLKQKPRSLRNISGGIMQTNVRLQIMPLTLGNNLPMLILVKFINHNPIVPCQFPNTLNNSITQKLNITTGERLQLRNRAHGELLRLNGTGDRKRWVLRARGLQIDDDSDVNPVKDAIKRLTGGSGMDPDRVHEANFTRGEGLLEKKGAGVSE